MKRSTTGIGARRALPAIRWATLGLLLALQPASALEGPTRTILPNGIPLIVQDTYSSPTVSLNIYIRVGSVFEKPELNGISHFYEHMFFRGTPTRSGLEFKRQIEALGGTTNASTTRDFTHFYINLPKAYLNEGLQLLADAYLNAEVAQESVDAERQVVLEEYRLGLAQPMRQVSERLYGMVFAKHPYGKSIIGTEANLNAINRADLLNFKRTYYVPSRTNLVVIGDIDSAAVQARCRELFGNYKAAAPVEEPFTVDIPPAENVKLSESSKSNRGQVFMGFLGPSVKDRPDVYQVDVLCFMLGVGKHSLIGKALNTEVSGDEGAANYLTQAYPGVIVLTAACEAGREDATGDLLNKALADIQAGNFDDKDIKRAKNLLSNSYRFGSETNAGKAENYGFYETIDKLDFALNYLTNIEKVNKADLVAAAKKYFGRNHYSLTLRAPSPNSNRGRS